MPIKAIAKIEAAWYVPTGEHDDDGSEVEGATKFKIKPLDGVRYMELLAGMKVDESGNMSIGGPGMVYALRHGLVGWKNFTDDAGREIKFTHSKTRLIPADILGEIAGEIIARSELSEDERKN